MIRNRSFEVHFGWGAAVALALIVWGHDPAFAFFVAALTGFAVEAVQAAFPRAGQASLSDAAFTAAGGAVGSLVAISAEVFGV